MTQFRASVVVPLACPESVAIACLEGVAAQVDAPHHEVIIVHDGSPALERLLRGVDGEVSVLQAHPWPGEQAAIALAAQHAQTDTVVVVRGHQVCPAGWLAEILISDMTVPSTPPEVTVIVPTLDITSMRVQDCLSAIKATLTVPHLIVVVDNGAPPQGFTDPVNAGIRAAPTPYVVVMNDDVVTLPGWWAPLQAELDAGASVVFPTTVGSPMRYDFAAWCFALSRATIDEFGATATDFLDPSMKVWYQDTDLLYRLRAAGQPPRNVPSSQIRHGLSQTVNAQSGELRTWVTRQVQADQQAFLAKHPDAVPTPIGLSR